MCDAYGSNDLNAVAEVVNEFHDKSYAHVSILWKHVKFCMSSQRYHVLVIHVHVVACRAFIFATIVPLIIIF